MSQDNVELVRLALTEVTESLDFREVISAVREGRDHGSVDWAHPEMEWVIADGPSTGSWTGVAGMVESISGMLGAWEEWHMEADEYRTLDGERVLVLTQLVGRGRTSGLEV